MSKILSSFKRIWRVVRFAMRPAPVISGLYLVLAVILALLPLAYDGAIALFLNTLQSGQGDVWIYFILFAITLVLPDLLLPLQLYFNKIHRYKNERDLEIGYTEHVSHLDQARLENPDFKDREERGLRYGRQWPFNITFYQFSIILANTAGVAVAGIALFAINPLYFLLAFVAVIPAVIVEFTYVDSIWGVNDGEKTNRRLLNDRKALLNDRARLVEMQLFGSVQYVLDLMYGIFDRFIAKQSRVERRTLGYAWLAQVWQAAFFIGILVYVVQSIIADEIALGTFVFILGAVARFSGNLTQIFSSTSTLQEAVRYAGDLLYVYDTQSLVTDPSDPQPVPDDLTIKFENVSFIYPHDPERRLILKNLDLTIATGDKIALIGLNGAGKSTLIKLLCRFYDPTEGRITVGGVDLRNVKRSDWYERLSVLFQDYATLNFLIKEAIGFSDTKDKRSPDLSRIIQSAEQSRASEFIEAFAKKYETQVGVEFGGQQFSRGQDQKLALARSFYRDPKILILDEPTAAVDAAAEAETFANLEGWAGNKTLLLISHRFSTVRQVDRIIILDDGAIAEDGSHEELMSLDGKYASLFRKQARGYQ